MGLKSCWLYRTSGQRLPVTGRMPGRPTGVGQLVTFGDRKVFIEQTPIVQRLAFIAPGSPVIFLIGLRLPAAEHRGRCLHHTLCPQPCNGVGFVYNAGSALSTTTRVPPVAALSRGQLHDYLVSRSW
jgi:hypothetical protein